MSTITPEQQGLLIIPVGALLLYFLAADEQEDKVEAQRDLTKESEFLEFNKDSLMINLLHAEDHLKNLKMDDKIAVEKGEAACVIKHWVNGEGHASEAVAHSNDLHGQPAEYQKIGLELNIVRHKFQNGDITPAQALEETRNIRRKFEAFNPSFDVSKCKACKLEK
jgi:hypothetical protein